jgi:hypothetical protein
MNIGAGNGYPSSSLSNFAGHRFTIDDVECYSMEGFLQGLKFKSIEMQAEVCKLIGKAAKFKGKRKAWYTTQTLYWKGVPYKRQGKEYQALLDRAYVAMYEQSESFKKALLAAGKDASFTHTIGNSDPTRTVLTVSEFCGRITRLRDSAFREKEKENN